VLYFFKDVDIEKKFIPRLVPTRCSKRRYVQLNNVKRLMVAASNSNRLAKLLTDQSVHQFFRKIFLPRFVGPLRSPAQQVRSMQVAKSKIWTNVSVLIFLIPGQ